MSELQRRHENYWGRCWGAALGKQMGAEVRSSRPDSDPPDIDFQIRRSDGTVEMSWGEVAGSYYDGHEASWLWGAHAGNGGRGYWEPDAVMGMRAQNLVVCKRAKYRELVCQRGHGHLLILLHSPLTTRSTRVEAESGIRELLETGPAPNIDPFETVWLGYRLPWTTPEEREDPEHAFRDTPDGDRFNFLKCICYGRGAEAAAATGNWRD